MCFYNSTLIGCKFFIQLLISFDLFDEMFTFEDVSEFFDQNPGANNVEVVIDSPGGSVEAGFSIHDFLVNSGREITTIGYNVKSIATVIFLSGKERIMSANGKFFIHNPWMNISGEAEELRRGAELLQKEEDRILEFYFEKTGANEAQQEIIRDRMKNEIAISPQEAVELGFATKVLEPVQAFALAPFQTPPAKAEKSTEIKSVDMNNDTKNWLEKQFAQIVNLITPKKEEFAQAWEIHPR